MIEHKQRSRSVQGNIARECKPPIVQNDPFAIEAHRHHSVILITQIFAHEYKPDVFFPETSSNKANVLCDSIVLAITAAGRKSFKRRAPSIWNTPLSQVAGGTDRGVNCSIKDSNAAWPPIGTGFRNEPAK
jgi:hypothetical protein